MKIIALADTHIRSGSITESLPDGLMELIMQADVVIHAGDFITKDAYDELSDACRLEAVYGNMDELSLKKFLPEKKIVTVDSFRVGIIHEAALMINDISGVRYMAKEMGVNILIFGHIHRPLIEKSDVLLICPGSPTAPRLSEPSICELNIYDGKVDGKVITLPGIRCSMLGSFGDFGE